MNIYIGMDVFIKAGNQSKLVLDFNFQDFTFKNHWHGGQNNLLSASRK